PDEMREIDRRTIEETGIPGVVLMENAGKETVCAIDDYFPDLHARQVVIFCGKGNNGGDGFVISRHLWNRGCNVIILLLTNLDNLKGDARINAMIARNMSIPVIEIIDLDKLRNMQDAIEKADIVIDALLGTGLKKHAETLFAEAINQINNTDAFIVSVDIPSGLAANSCQIIGPAVSADLTVTYGLPKPALLLYPAATHAGQVIVADISIPQKNIDSLDIHGEILSPHNFPAFFSPRSPDSHKGRFGHLLILAGSPGKTGAAILAAKASARSGAGLVTVAVPETLNPILETNLTEIMTLPLTGPHQHFHPDHLDVLRKALVGKSAVLIGPGIGTNEMTVKCLKMLIQDIDIPLILDADALNIIASTPGPWFKTGVPTVITPHPGEFSRLTKTSMDLLIKNQLVMVTEFAKANLCTVVFKTARTLVAFPDGHYLINTTGNAGMASGGSGDILAGMIAGLTAQNIVPEQATSAVVFWHGLSGDVTAHLKGEEEMLASDTLDFMFMARRLMINNPEHFNGVFTPYANFERIQDLNV
ncbi:NAD(P)H-hydrate dehydratase, partial [bacterium]|nr:NAD(P)H-hydrate dehydratase [bacterium]